jgi:hypothetical protein
MKPRQPETIRLFLASWLWTTLYGIRFAEWLRLLRRQRFAIELPFVPRAALVTLTSLLTSLISRYEAWVYGPRIAQATVERPIFILGHWRSGTSYLFRLLAVDERFAYPNMWQALNPHTFLTTDRCAAAVQSLAPKTRLIDGISSNFDLPYEDEFALYGTGCSPFLSWAFPRSAADYDRYLTFRDVPAAEVAAWRAALRRFYQKLTWKYNRPLLLKSPPHTCRIKLLLELFPDARFIHIARDPYAVFRSTRQQDIITAQGTALQRADPRQREAWIIRRYQQMYEAYFAERSLIPPGRLVELRYEDLVQDPLDQLQRIYEQLDLPDFAVVRPAFQRYLAAVSSYRQNTHPDLSPALRHTIARACRQAFETWGYPLEVEEVTYVTHCDRSLEGRSMG